MIQVINAKPRKTAGGEGGRFDVEKRQSNSSSVGTQAASTVLLLFKETPKRRKEAQHYS
jgi:hypothetical protein